MRPSPSLHRRIPGYRVSRWTQKLDVFRPMSLARIQHLASWVVSLGFVALAVLYLNAALFSAWMSGGPPNPYPQGWKHLAFGQLVTAMASFLLAIGSYKLIRPLPAWKRPALSLVVVGVAMSAAPYFGRFVLQDRCLDQGGQWRNVTLECTLK